MKRVFYTFQFHIPLDFSVFFLLLPLETVCFMENSENSLLMLLVVKQTFTLSDVRIKSHSLTGIGFIYNSEQTATMGLDLDNFVHWVNNHPKVFKILKAILVVISTVLSIFVVQSSIQRYVVYVHRPSYYLHIENRTVNSSSYYYYSSQTTFNVTYYMVRQNATYRNCSTKAAASVDISYAYYMIVSKTSSSMVFVVVFWLNFVFTLILLIFDIVVTVKFCKNEYELKEGGFHIVVLIIDKILLKLWLSSTMAPPTYYASSFDYTKVCVEFASDWDLSLANVAYLTLFFPVIGIVVVATCWGFSCRVHNECVWNFHLTDAIRWLNKDSGNGKKGTKRRCCFIIVMCYLCPILGFMFIFGLILSISMIIKQATRNEGVVLVINTVV